MQLSSNPISKGWRAEGFCLRAGAPSVLTVLCVGGSPYTVTAVYVLDRTRPFCVIGQNISFWQHLYFLRTVIKPESEQGFCRWNHCHCFSITTLPDAHSSGLQSLWSLLELVPPEWTDWWVGGGVCASAAPVCVRVCMGVCVHVYIYVCACTYIHKAKVAFMVHVFWISGDTFQTSGRLLNEIRQTQRRAKSTCVIQQTGNKKASFLTASFTGLDPCEWASLCIFSKVTKGVFPLASTQFKLVWPELSGYNFDYCICTIVKLEQHS